ncbi:MAG: DMT family transporter [Proteobacteria bacterium]|jgi:drug/metabolite transporter (DMT)-like permease|nr:DMT family transporter [Pseudomonadota bacterium]
MSWTNNSNTKAIVAMLVATIALSSMTVFVKIIGPDFHPIQITFLRAVIVLLVLSPFILKSGVKEVVSTKKPVLHIFRALAGAASNILYFYCYQRMSIADVTIIGQAVPIFVCILATFFLQEKVGWRRWLAISFGFLGVVLVINPAGNIQIESFIALLATLLFASTFLFMRVLGKTESPTTVVFYYMSISVIVTGLAQPFYWKSLSSDFLWLMLGVGISAAIGQMLMSYSLKNAEASIITPFKYSGIIWAIIFDIVIWDLSPLVSTIVGGLIITLSGIYIFQRETKAKAK